jgi:phosphoglycolate phosphatase
MPKLVECIAAAAFDLDGTLVDTVPDLAAAANVMLSILGGRPLREDRVPALVGGGIDQFVANALRESVGTVPDRALQASTAALFRELYGQCIFERSRVYPGAVQLLRVLKERGIAACCVTNKESRFALPLVEAAGLGELLRFTLSADRLEERKPNPILLLRAGARIGIDPAQLLYVGDARSDVLAARAAGCRIVAVDYGYDDQLSHAESRPDAIVSDLRVITELSVPAHNAMHALRATV